MDETMLMIIETLKKLMWEPRLFLVPYIAVQRRGHFLQSDREFQRFLTFIDWVPGALQSSEDESFVQPHECIFYKCLRLIL